jgi:hypothetical protein
VTSLAFSPDSRRLASASRDGTAKIWSLDTKRPLITLVQSAEVLSVAFSPDGRRLATGTSANSVHLWNTADGKAIRVLPAREKPLLLKFSPSGEQLVSSDRQTRLRLWSLNEDTAQSELFAVDQPIVAVRFHPDGRSLAAASPAGFQEWSLPSMRQTRGVSNLSGVTALAFTPKGHVITLASNRDRVTVQDATASEEIGRLQHGVPVQTAALSFDGMKSFTYTGGGDLWLWEARPALVAAHAAPVPEPSVMDAALVPEPSVMDAEPVLKPRTSRAGSVPEPSTAGAAKVSTAKASGAPPVTKPSVAGLAPVSKQSKAGTAPVPEPSAATIAANETSPDEEAPEEAREGSGKRKGVFRRLIGVFRK